MNCVVLGSAAAAASALLHINIIILGAEAAAAAGGEWWNLVRSVRAPIGHFLRLPIAGHRVRPPEVLPTPGSLYLPIFLTSTKCAIERHCGIPSRGSGNVTHTRLQQ